jgi:hypothetical protein
MNAAVKVLVLLAVTAMVIAACSSTEVITDGIGGSAAHTGTAGNTSTAGSGGHAGGTHPGGSSATGGGTAGTGATAGAGGGGITGPCDVGDCGACVSSDCTNALCDGTFTDCANNSACVDLFDCVAACSTPSCEHQCHTDNSTGVVDYYAALSCLYCDANTCSVDCDAFCPVEPPPDPPCDQGDCDTCSSSECAYYWCSVQIEACFGDQDCLSYESCEVGCNEDPTCIHGCKTTLSTGAALYYDLIDCLYCDGNTCATDCAAYCPIEPPPDPPCDEGDCGACGSSDCAYFWCAPEVEGCFNSSACQTYQTCETNCGSDPACLKACETNNPAGATLFYDLLNCLYCDTNTCSSDCTDYCPMEPPPDSPCDQGDCGTCGSSECAYFWCGAELDACLNTPACLSYESCEVGCNGDPTCIQGCQASYPAGATLYYGLLNCLYCDTTTCSVDCAAFCPIGPPSGSCDVGDCNTCINSSCAAAACAAEMQTCSNNADCVSLGNCLAGCSNQGCSNQCENNNSGGQADYDAMMACLTCRPSSCAGDCAVYCP